MTELGPAEGSSHKDISVTGRASGLTRSLHVHATAPPRRNTAIPLHQRDGTLRERRRLFVGGLSVLLGLVVVALFVLWEWHNAAGVTYSHWGQLGKAAGDDYDEGAYVLSAQLLLHGYALFSQVFSAQPAFFLPSLALAVRAVSDPVVAAHMYEAACGVLTLLGVFFLAATAYRPLAGPLAAAFLAVTPGFLLYAHAVESEMPMLGFCTLSVAAAQLYYLRGRRSAALLAGLLLMVGTEMKLLSAVVVVPLALLLAGGFWRGYCSGRARSAILLDGGAFLGALLIPALLVLLLVAPAAQWDQAVTFHLRSGHVSTSVLPPSMGTNMAALQTFLGYDPGLLLAALVGFVVAVVSGLLGAHRESGRRLYAPAYLPLVYLLWALSTALFLLRYHPLFQHQLVPLLPPLALLGAGLTMAWPRRTAARTLVPLAAIASVLYAGLLLHTTLTLDNHLFTPSDLPRRAALISLVDRATRPGDVVICDDPNVALGAHRLVPPGLADPSRVRTATGYLTVAQTEAATLRYHAAIIVASRPMFALYMPSYLTWAAAHYRAIPSPVAGAQVYLPR